MSNYADANSSEHGFDFEHGASMFGAPDAPAPADEPEFVAGDFYNSESYTAYDPAPVDYHYGRPSAFHYVPPSAVSTRYYALSNPNEYAAAPATYTAPGAAAHIPTPAITPALLQHHPPATADAFRNTPAPSRSPAHLNPVLPKQRRNRDDPGGESRQVTQPTTQHEDQPAGTSRTLGTSQGRRADYQQSVSEENPPVVPSQRKLGAALDRLRFGKHGPNRGTGKEPASGQPDEEAASEPESPLSEEDAARYEAIKTRLGLEEPEPERPRASSSRTKGSSSSIDIDLNRSVIYSPTTGRKLVLATEPDGQPSVQIAGTTIAKKPYKRGTPVACAFCRKRKIACGGPQEGDRERRCLPCIQRDQPCDFPATTQRPLARARPSGGYTGPVIVNEFK